MRRLHWTAGVRFWNRESSDVLNSLRTLTGIKAGRALPHDDVDDD
jgi:hypothetical protein